jgi:molybdopterin synthase catalytic subunit
MTLEHYPGMAETEIACHVAEAQARWKLAGVTVIHRHGRIEPGANIVLVVVAAVHRGEAFAAAEFLMDYLKTRAPFWKREERPEGAAWVAAKAEDTNAADRWVKPPHPSTTYLLQLGDEEITKDRLYRGLDHLLAHKTALVL